MQISQRVKMSVDITMTILSIILMGDTMMFPADIVHKILGACLFALWILHTIFNHRWYASLFKGKYPPYRIMQIVVNLEIAFCTLCLMYSGITMAFMLPGMGIARSMHLFFSHWYYIFMCAHIGMHLGMIFSRIKSAGKSQTESKAKKIVLRVVLALICTYGIYAFIIRGIWKYLFLSQQFFFFDLEHGYIFFALDYLSILVLIATLSYLLGKFLSLRKNK